MIVRSDGELEFFVDRDRSRDELRVYLIQRRSNGRFWCGTVNGDTGGVVMEDVGNEGDKMKPLLVMGARYQKDFLKAIAAMLEDEGVLTQKAARLEALVAEKDARITDLQGMIHLLSGSAKGEDWHHKGDPIYKATQQKEELQRRMLEQQLNYATNTYPVGLGRVGGAPTPGNMAETTGWETAGAPANDAFDRIDRAVDQAAQQMAAEVR